VAGASDSSGTWLTSRRRYRDAGLPCKEQTCGVDGSFASGNAGTRDHGRAAGTGGEISVALGRRELTHLGQLMDF
jgi:hypothetical protein